MTRVLYNLNIQDNPAFPQTRVPSYHDDQAQNAKPSACHKITIRGCTYHINHASLAEYNFLHAHAHGYPICTFTLAVNVCMHQ